MTVPTQIFLNLPVADLAVSRKFYTDLGYTINEAFSGETAASVVISDTIYLMLLTPDFFATFLTDTAAADAKKLTEGIFALSVESREAADRLADAALAAGGSAARDPEDMGFMYSRSFRDPDGHFWEVFWMDPQAAQDGPPSE
ncbi:MAG: glyoxalase [Glaciihabitans sp.]|nr:glyoxalase [Glaciihabitans sp.]